MEGFQFIPFHADGNCTVGKLNGITHISVSLFTTELLKWGASAHKGAFLVF